MNLYELQRKIDELLEEKVSENTEVLIIDEEDYAYEIIKTFYNDIDKVLEVKVARV